MILFVGERSFVCCKGCSHSKHKAATKKNCTMVRVTGNLNWLRMTLPVLEDTADVVYHRVQRDTKRIVSVEGKASGGRRKGLGDGDRLRAGLVELGKRLGDRESIFS